MKPWTNMKPWTKMKLKKIFANPTSSVNKVKLNSNKKRVWLLDLPGYGNLGDEAIAVSEVYFLRECCVKHDYDLELFNQSEFEDNFKWYKKHIDKQDIIVLQGGGNLGNAYQHLEDIRKIIIHEFPKNKIVLFPQTYYFEKSNEGIKKAKQTDQVYNHHPNLTLIAREKFSYNKMKKHFPNNKVYLLPDMVLYYPFNKNIGSKNKNLVTFCMRNDTEKSVTNQALQKLYQYFKSKGFEVKTTDTVVDENFDSDIDKAKVAVDNKIEELAKGSLVVTDRLHGMVLSVLGNTNCIVFGNYNYKIKGVYQWLDDIKGVRYLNEDDSIENAIQSLNGVSYRYNQRKFHPEFKKMEKLIFE